MFTSREYFSIQNMYLSSTCVVAKFIPFPEGTITLTSWLAWNKAASPWQPLNVSLAIRFYRCNNLVFVTQFWPQERMLHLFLVSLTDKTCLNLRRWAELFCWSCRWNRSQWWHIALPLEQTDTQPVSGYSQLCGVKVLSPVPGMSDTCVHVCFANATFPVPRLACVWSHGAATRLAHLREAQVSEACPLVEWQHSSGIFAIVSVSMWLRRGTFLTVLRLCVCTRLFMHRDETLCLLPGFRLCYSVHAE